MVPREDLLKALHDTDPFGWRRKAWPCPEDNLVMAILARRATLVAGARRDFAELITRSGVDLQLEVFAWRQAEHSTSRDDFLRALVSVALCQTREASLTRSRIEELAKRSGFSPRSLAKDTKEYLE